MRRGRAGPRPIGGREPVPEFRRGVEGRAPTGAATAERAASNRRGCPVVDRLGRQDQRIGLADGGRRGDGARALVDGSGTGPRQHVVGRGGPPWGDDHDQNRRRSPVGVERNHQSGAPKLTGEVPAIPIQHPRVRPEAGPVGGGQGLAEIAPVEDADDGLSARGPGRRWNPRRLSARSRPGSGTIDQPRHRQPPVDGPVARRVVPSGSSTSTTSRRSVSRTGTDSVT